MIYFFKIGKIKHPFPSGEWAIHPVLFLDVYDIQELSTFLHPGEDLDPKRIHSMTYHLLSGEHSSAADPLHKQTLNTKGNLQQRQRKKHSMSPGVTDSYLSSIPKYKAYEALLPLFSTNNATALPCFSEFPFGTSLEHILHTSFSTAFFHSFFIQIVFLHI